MNQIRSGIYMIYCDGNGRRYVGSSVDIHKRWKDHRITLKRGRHGNQHLQNAYNKYGYKAFTYSILEEVSRDRLIEREQFWMDLLKPEFNIAPFARATGLGLSPSEERRSKIAESNRRHWKSLTPEQRAERAMMATHPHTEATKRLLSEKSTANNPRNWLGKHRSEETKLKIAESLTGHKNGPPSDETRAKIAEANTGKHPSAETLQKLSESHKGKTLSDETRRKLSESHKGKPHGAMSDETKAKLRAIALAQHADPEYQAKHAAGMAAVMSTPEMHEKLSAAHKGKKLTKAHRKHLGQAGRGKTRSPETKARMSAAKREWWAKRKSESK